jgi:CsoR family transcriptional regulator, copper-sensing transcriptional repressor
VDRATQNDKAIRDRLKRAEGQLGGVARMLEEGRACEDVVSQLMAVRAAVDRAAGELVVAHIDECTTRLPPEQVRETVGRAIKMLGRIG